MGATVPDELDVEVRGLSSADPGERAGMVDNANARIGSADGEVHRDARHGVFDRRGDPAGHRRPEAGVDLEVERIAGGDRIDRAVGDRRRRSIDGAGQLRKRLEPLTGSDGWIGVGAQTNDEGAKGVEASDRLLETGPSAIRGGGTGGAGEVGHRERHAAGPGDHSLPLGLIGKANVGGGENDRQGTHAEAAAANGAVRGENVPRWIRHKRREARDVAARSRRELCRDQSGWAAVGDRGIVVAVKADAGDELVEGLDVGLRRVAAVSRRHPVES